MEEQLSYRLQKLREGKNVTLQTVANEISKNVSTVKRYENGEIKNLPYEVIIKLSEFYSVSPNYIITGDSDKRLYDDSFKQLSALDKKAVSLFRQFQSEHCRRKALKQVEISLEIERLSREEANKK